MKLKKGASLLKALKTSNQDLSAAPTFKRHFTQKASFTEEFKKGTNSRTLGV